MAFDLKIKNIGKLANAKIRIDRFTVFAGPNNTGKSTVSKFLYSLFDAMNANHAEVHIRNLTAPLELRLRRSIRFARYSGDRDEFVPPLFGEIKRLHNLVAELPVGDLDELENIIPQLRSTVKGIQEKFLEIRRPLKTLLDDEDTDEVRESLTDLEAKIDDMNATDFITAGIEYKVRENLIENFQIPRLSDLRGKKGRSNVTIQSFGKFGFSNGEIDFEIEHALLWELQQFSNVIYLESPVYWKLKTALEDFRPTRYLRRGRRTLSGVPGYFHDLASTLKHQYTGNMIFPDVFKKLTEKNVLGGKLVISETGDLLFQENRRRFPLPITAMGVANLGILALLIERKVLDEDSFLFIDEPEAHLHPAWQVIMAETLFELAKGGVNVVIATHSADILKWLEVHVKKNPDDEGLIALNKFSVDGVDQNGQDFRDKMAAIKQELTKPFADLYTAGL